MSNANLLGWRPSPVEAMPVVAESLRAWLIVVDHLAQAQRAAAIDAAVGVLGTRGYGLSGRKRRSVAASIDNEATLL